MAAVDHARIYREQPEAYDALVRAEDCDGGLGRVLDPLISSPCAALEIGVGTGRVTRLLLERGATVRGWEQSAAMLGVARSRLSDVDPSRLELFTADAYGSDFGEGWADLAVAGWVFGHAVGWHPADWRERVGGAIASMRRALRPGGRLVVIETLGTGFEAPSPPHTLVPYLDWLEHAQGMSRTVLRTDYSFDDAGQAERAMAFFFGPELAGRVRSGGLRRVPECTGAWIG